MEIHSFVIAKHMRKWFSGPFLSGNKFCIDKIVLMYYCIIHIIQ